MVNCADSLVWQLVNNNNSFMVKKNGRTNRSGAVRFSKESGNVKNVSSFKYSGIANSKTIGIDANGQDITMKLKTVSKSNAPKKAVATTPLKKCYRRSVRTITKQAVDNYYRQDLSGAALARYGKLNMDVKVKKGLRKGAALKRGRGAGNDEAEPGDDDMPGLN